MTKLLSYVLDATLPYVWHQLQNFARNAVRYELLAMKIDTVNVTNTLLFFNDWIIEGMLSLSYLHSLVLYCTVGNFGNSLTNLRKKQKGEIHVLCIFLYLQILILTPICPKISQGAPYSFLGHRERGLVNVYMVWLVYPYIWGRLWIHVQWYKVGCWTWGQGRGAGA